MGSDRLYTSYQTHRFHGELLPVNTTPTDMHISRIMPAISAANLQLILVDGAGSELPFIIDPMTFAFMKGQLDVDNWNELNQRHQLVIAYVDRSQQPPVVSAIRVTT